MNMKDILKLAASLAVCLAAGFIGSVFTFSAIPTWYAGLNKPAFNPPNWLFGPVWTILYILMGIAAYLIWRKGLQHNEVKLALIVFIVQLVLNVAWSIIFFNFHSPLLALVDIILLWLAIIMTLIYFFGLSLLAGWLMVPYILWVSFAAFLNFTIWRLNP